MATLLVGLEPSHGKYQSVYSRGETKLTIRILDLVSLERAGLTVVPGTVKVVAKDK